MLRLVLARVGDTRLARQRPNRGSIRLGRANPAAAVSRPSILTGIQLDRNHLRFYGVTVWPDLFDRALLSLHRVRIGTPGHMRLDPHPDAEAALNALTELVRAKCRRSYRDGPI